MPQQWYTSSSPVELTEDSFYQPSVTLVVDPGSGDVQIQVMNAAGTYATPADPLWTITSFDVIELPRANMPPTRIIATGNAQFQVYGEK